MRSLITFQLACRNWTAFESHRPSGLASKAFSVDAKKLETNDFSSEFSLVSELSSEEDTAGGMSVMSESSTWLAHPQGSALDPDGGKPEVVPGGGTLADASSLSDSMGMGLAGVLASSMTGTSETGRKEKGRLVSAAAPFRICTAGYQAAAERSCRVGPCMSITR
jgi:hypothetical protein